MKNIRRERVTGKPPGLSKYAAKRRARPTELISLDPVTIPLPRERGLEAVIPDFTARQEFIFPRTPAGEPFFLSMRTITKSGLNVRPGDSIICNVENGEPGRCRRVVHIHRVLKKPSK